MFSRVPLRADFLPDLHMVRELLISRLGPEFEHTAVNNLHYHVSTRVSVAGWTSAQLLK